MSLKLSIIVIEESEITHNACMGLSAKYKVEIINKKIATPLTDNYYQNAIYSTSGDYICFVSTIEQIDLACQSFKILKSDRFVIIGICPSNKIHRIFGIRNTCHTLPPLFQKAYLANNLEVVGRLEIREFINALIKHADKKGYLDLCPAYVNTQQNYNLASDKLYRPTTTIIKNKLLSRVGVSVPTKEDSIKYQAISMRTIKYSEDIPVFINCRDRVEPLMKLMEWLEKEGLMNIILVDNNSSYKPLLKYYEKTTHKVYRLKQNLGQRAPWDSGLVSLYANRKPYIVTDPDILPSIHAEHTMKFLITTLNKYRKYIKVGLALRIDNLSESYSQKDQVIKWEKQFWQNKIEKNIYIADVDTTFALYRPNTPYIIRPALRVAGEYAAEHEPWYQDSASPTAEYIYYLKHARREIASWGIDDSTSSSVYKN